MKIKGRFERRVWEGKEGLKEELGRKGRFEGGVWDGK